MHFGKIVNGFKTACNKALRGLKEQGKVKTGLMSLWEPGYNDRILDHEGQLQRMKNYIADNPRRWAIKRNNPEFVITIAFGKSNDLTRDISQFKRKGLSEISDSEDERLIPAQLAPSAVNSQPWYFKHTDDGFDVYKVRHNIVKRKILGKWNDVDIGIALSHLYVSNPETFEFEVKNKKDLKGYEYIGSLKI